MSFLPSSLPLLFYLHSSRCLRPLPDGWDLPEGGRASAEGLQAAGGPHSVALQTLTKYASEAFCVSVIVPDGVARDPEAPSCVWLGGTEEENRRAQTG